MKMINRCAGQFWTNRNRCCWHNADQRFCRLCLSLL